MSIKPHPQAFEQAFLFGESVVLLFYRAELSWFHANDFDQSSLNLVDTRVGQVQNLVENLRRIFPSRRRLCDCLTERIAEAWQAYCLCWGSDTQRNAIAAVNRDCPEAVADAYQDFLIQAPVSCREWTALKDAAKLFVDALPSQLRTLAQVGELVSQGQWYSEVYWQQQSQHHSFHRFLTVELHGQLNSRLRALGRKIPAARQIVCDLYSVNSQDALSRLKLFREQVLSAIRQHATDLETPPDHSPAEVTERDPNRLNRSAQLAWDSYNFAVDRLNPSESSARATDKAIWTWLNESGSTGGFPRDYQLPEFPTWSRYLRRARKFYGPDRDPLLAQRTNRSTVRRNEV